MTRTEMEELQALIPNYKYRNYDFDTETLISKRLSNHYYSSETQEFGEALEELINEAKIGKYPKNNYFISAPNNYGKKYAVYTMIEELNYYGYKQTTILSMRELTQANVDLKALFDNDIIYIYIDTLDIKPDFYHYLLGKSDMTATPIMFLSRFKGFEIIRNKEDSRDIFKNNLEDYDYSYIKTIQID